MTFFKIKHNNVTHYMHTDKSQCEALALVALMFMSMSMTTNEAEQLYTTSVKTTSVFDNERYVTVRDADVHVTVCDAAHMHNSTFFSYSDTNKFFV